MFHAKHTDDYPQERCKKQLREVFELSLMTAVLCLVLLCITTLVATESAPYLERMTIAVMFLTSCAFALAWFLIRDHGYYLASLPVGGVYKLGFWVLSWVLWLPLLISLINMRRDVRKKEELDRQTRESLAEEARYYAIAGFEERFPIVAREELVSFCGRQALLSRLEMSEEEARERVERVLSHPDVLKLELRDTSDLVLTVRARREYQHNRYDLGNYELHLKNSENFQIVQARDGRLANEMAVEDSLDDELLNYLARLTDDLKRQIYAGHIDWAVEMLARALNDNACPYPWMCYHVDEHYHLAQELPMVAGTK